MTLAPLTIEQFQRRFVLEACPFWFAYNAANKRELVGKFRNDDPDIMDEDLLEYSWMQFVELVETYPFGHIKVECRSSPQANATKSPTLYVKWGEGFHGASSNQSIMPAMGGGNMGSNQWGMIQYMLNMQSQHFREMREMGTEMQRLNFENQQLAAALEADDEPSFKEKMIMEGIGAVKDMLRPRLNMPQQQPVVAGNLGVMGQKNTQPAPDGGVHKQQRRRSLDDIMIDLNAIQQALPNLHINDITRALALFVQGNPAGAEGFLQPLVKQLHEQG